MGNEPINNQELARLYDEVFGVYKPGSLEQKQVEQYAKVIAGTKIFNVWTLYGSHLKPFEFVQELPSKYKTPFQDQIDLVTLLDAIREDRVDELRTQVRDELEYRLQRFEGNLSRKIKEDGLRDAEKRYSPNYYYDYVPDSAGDHPIFRIE